MVENSSFIFGKGEDELTYDVEMDLQTTLGFVKLALYEVFP